MHYSRVLEEYWKDRLLKFKAAGLNAVQTYVPWNFHETYPEIYNFSGNKDLEGFLQTAKEVGLYVILRAGPYICGEWEMGGLPSWLLTHQNISLRSSDPVYMKYVDRWMSVLLPKMAKWLYVNGGNIISVQVENEYGSYPACDREYLKGLHTIFRSHLGEDVVLFTTDGASDRYLKCGAYVELFYATVDFGGANAASDFKAQREVEPRGPLVNSEYYTGWLDHWGSPHSRVSPDDVAKGLDAILSQNASVNMYMFEGGTNFGFWNGANYPRYNSVPTSYDYDAPLTESGDPYVEKFAKISSVIENYCNCETHIPATRDKASYGKIMAVQYASLSASPQLYVKTVTDENVVSMEEMGQVSGFITYQTSFTPTRTGNISLMFEGVHDRALILINDVYYETIERASYGTDSISVSIPVTNGAKIDLMVFVENMGRINYGPGNDDRKGLIEKVTSDPVINFGDWSTKSLPLNNTDKVVYQSIDHAHPDRLPTQMAFYRFLVSVPENASSFDTYLDLTGWGKGVAFVNGFNIGRYWPAKGPQKSLYVPGSLLTSKSTNEIVLFEIDAAPCKILNNCHISLIDQLILV